jgi:hypothetical protein
MVQISVANYKKEKEKKRKKMEKKEKRDEMERKKEREKGNAEGGTEEVAGSTPCGRYFCLTFCRSTPTDSNSTKLIRNDAIS